VTLVGDATLVVDCRATLGEGLTWDAHAQVWLWTDIEGRRLWRHDPSTGTTHHCAMPDRVGTFVVAQSGRLLIGLAKQLAWADIDWAQGVATCTPVVDVERDQPTTRVNDGRVDRHGHFVFGTMDEADGHPATGHLYQYSTRHGLRRLDVGPVSIANSICFSPSGDSIYFCDSPTRRILRGRYDPDRATIDAVETFVTLAEGQGVPDGSVVDADGALWNAEWGGAAVRRYAPDGTRLGSSPVPAAHVTCPAFGGPLLDVLCVTTARADVPAADLAARPDTGGLFRIDAHGARGLAERPFAD